jgi:sulfur-oxidizing protein SoxY
MKGQDANGRMTRRALLRLVGAAGAAAAGASLGLIRPIPARAEAKPLGAPQPDEKVEATMKRLFGDRAILPADGRVKLDLPLIAENGSVVPVSVDSDLPMTPAKYVKNIYILSDKNRRPLNVKFSLTPESGRGSVAANIRLARTTDVRAVVEMSDGTLYMATQEVKVTVGGCGG